MAKAHTSALNGIRVVDFSWQVMGPVCSKYLADFGAEVIKIESTAALDAARGNLPYREGKPGINRSCHYAWLNTGKRSITLNLKHPKGVEIVKKLICLADVVMENFTPGTMERLGLDYKVLKQVSPDIIMVSLSSVGQGGPYRLMSGFGNFIGAWAGMNTFLGPPGQEPVIGYVPHPDYLGAHTGMIAIIGALLYRQRTGKGQYIDISMLEATVPTITPALLDYLANGREAVSTGNRCPQAAPHGIYRCAGEDSWCAISIYNDKEWDSLVTAMGNPLWAMDTKLSNIKGRKENEDLLDKKIEAWTIHYPPKELMHLLQSQGVAAGAVQNGKDLTDDPQLNYREFFKVVEGHQELDSHYSSAASFILRETPAWMGPAPCIGQDNDYVFTELLGFSDNQFIELIESGVIQ